MLYWFFTSCDNVVHLLCACLDLVKFSETDCQQGLTLTLISVLMYEILLKTFSCHFKLVNWSVCVISVLLCLSCASQLLVGSQLSQLSAMSFYAAPGFQPVATVVGYR